MVALKVTLTLGVLARSALLVWPMATYAVISVKLPTKCLGNRLAYRYIIVRSAACNDTPDIVDLSSRP